MIVTDRRLTRSSSRRRKMVTWSSSSKGMIIPILPSRTGAKPRRRVVTITWNGTWTTPLIPFVVLKPPLPRRHGGLRPKSTRSQTCSPSFLTRLAEGQHASGDRTPRRVGRRIRRRIISILSGQLRVVLQNKGWFT